MRLQSRGGMGTSGGDGRLRDWTRQTLARAATSRPPAGGLEIMRFLLRLLGYLMVAAGFVAMIVDGARSIANSAIQFTPLGDVLASLLRDRYPMIQATIERQIHPLLWDPIMVQILRSPAALLALVLGFLLLSAGRRPEPRIGIVTRR